jgi:hypothetical protein
MDLRYLGFLFAAYSWAVIVFAVIMVLWLVLNNVSEIAVAGIKVKPTIAFRSLGSLLILMVLFSLCMSYVVEQMPPEIHLQDDLSDAANQDRNQVKEEWRAFFEKITHQTDTMAFAFIKPERPQYPDYAALKESSVQYVLKIVIYWLPIAFMILEIVLLGYFSFPPDTETLFGCFFILLIGGTWLRGVWLSIDQITDILNDLASRTL